MLPIPYPISQGYANVNPSEPLCHYYADTSIDYIPPLADHRHNGIDIAVVVGTHVNAPLPGVVTFAGWDATGYGNCVRLNVGAYTLLYGHLSVIIVKVGQTVDVNHLLALSGNTGNSTGPHVHCSLIDNDTGRFINPAWGGDAMTPLIGTMPARATGGNTVAMEYETMVGGTRTVAAPGTMHVPNISGWDCELPASILALYAASSVKWGTPCSILASQGAQESAFEPGVISGDGGYGISQFTDETVARYYLGVPTGDWHPAALDPARAIDAQAHFMRDLTAQYGSLRAALGNYNGGPNWANIGAAVGYADGVLMRANGFEKQLAALPDATIPPIDLQYSLYRVIVPQYLRAKPDANSARKWLMLAMWECLTLGPITSDWALVVDLTGAKVGYMQRNHIAYEGTTRLLPANTRPDVLQKLTDGTLDTSFVAF